MTRLSAGYERNFLRIDFLIVLALTCASMAVGQYLYGLVAISAHFAPLKASLYSSLFSLGGCLLGFLISSAAVVLAFTELPRFQLLKDSGQSKAMMVVFFDAMRWFAVMTVAALAALFFDTQRSQITWVLYAMFFVSAISALRLYRCAWILKKLTFLAVASGTQNLTTSRQVA